MREAAVIYATVCSGIGAPECAWEPLGWTCAWQSEIEAFPSAVLAHHFPGVPNRGDMTSFKEWPDEPAIELLCGGTPCASFSVAGLRKGMDDPRGNLALVFLGVVDRHQPRWVVWENVPGVLSVDGGRAFGAFIGGLAKLGYGWAYRILDAQHFGVPQRRRRVFVVGHLGDWRPPCAVLFEPESLRGDSPPRREAGADVAGSLGGGSKARCGPDDNDARAMHLVAHSLRAEGFDASEDGTGRGTPIIVAVGLIPQVRRLVPEEAEALQGFPRGYTLIPFRGKPAADGPRYRALGNSMSVPVVRWIGERIQTFGARDE